MMSYIWTGCLILSFFMACLTGQTSALAQSALSGAAAAVELCLSMAGVLCLWSALAMVMERSGLMAGLTKLLGPVLGWLYPNTTQKARQSISTNMAANLLGLGNAATPPGIQAVQQMRRDAGTDAATDDMCLLIVVNTASIQLIPATVAALRQGLGSAAPFDILPAVWLTSLCSVGAGIFAARLLGLLWRRRGW